jgi:glycosyltransferase involved in cell wall biosynthesis
VRAIDRDARRHLYGVGEVPRGELCGELGALASEARLDTIPVWTTADGRIVTQDYDAAWNGASLRTRLAYIAEPLGWGRIGIGRATRLRALARRVLDVRRAGARGAAPGRQEPLGYLYREPAPGTRPLYSALHPALGDQLLTTSPDEPEALGYREVTWLGHLRACASTTGTLGGPWPAFGWAKELGARARPSPALAAALELPAEGSQVAREQLRIAGWAVAHGDRVRRVEIFADGERLGRARLALPRADLLRHPPAAASPDAILAGFEFVSSSGRLEPGVHTISALVTMLGGETLLLETRDVTVTRSSAAEEEITVPLPGRGAEGSRRLLAFAHGLDLGGAQRYFAEQLLALQRDGEWTCTVVAFRDGPWRAPLEEAGIEVHVTSPPPDGGAREYEGRIEELHAWCAPRMPSAALVNTLDCFIGADLAQRMGIPVVWALHESFEPAAWWTVSHRWSDEQAYALGRLQRALQGTDVTVFATDATRRVLEPHVDGARAVTVPYGIDLSGLDERRASFDRDRERRNRGFGPDARIVLCVALFDPRKAQALLAQAFSIVARDHPDAHLVLVGARADSYADSIRRHADAMSLGSRIHLVPATTDAYSWYLMADVVALASDVESMPLTLIEAMALERPVVASSVFGVPELVEDGHTGFLFEPNDLREIASALDRVLSMEPDELAEVARAGAELARERHSLPRYADWLADLLGSLDPGLVVADPP